MRFACLVAALLAGLPFAASADPKLDALLAAYPDKLASYTDSELIWKDGTRMPLGSAHADIPFTELLVRADIRDQFAIPYPLSTAPFQAPATDEDPGRIRNDAFFLKMYGDCRTGQVVPNLRPIAWLPKHGGSTVRATVVNGVAGQLGNVSPDLDTIPSEMPQYLVPTSCIYNCPPIAATNRF